MTRVLATIVFVAALSVSVAPASAQYPYGGFGTVYTPQSYYRSYNSYGYGNPYRSYGFNQSYRSSYGNYGYNQNYGGNYGYQSGYGVYRANGGPVTLPDGNTVSGFRNVIVLPPGYTVQAGF